MSPEEMAAKLLPRPSSLRFTGEVWRLPLPLPVRLPDRLRVALAADLAALADACQRRFGVVLEVGSTAAEGGVSILLVNDETVATEVPIGVQDAVTLPPATEQGYELEVTRQGARLRARSVHGVAYGLRTLRQWVELGGAIWPTFMIDDAPIFAQRGVSLDISRGRVPTQASLHTLVDRLAALKLNHLQLYMEHTFAFSCDPAISADCDALTPDDLRELDAHCRAHHVELVPALACFGHMGRILSLPQYGALAEIPASKNWEAMTWDERTRGLTLDASQPAARDLLRTLIAELLPCFTARRFNICCDETWDLGKGRGRDRAAQIGSGRMFLEHLLWLHQLVAEHGRAVLLWGDVIRNHPELIPELPRDVTVLNWGYTRDFDYDTTAQFRAHGFDTWVCPATHGWNRAVHDLSYAEENILGHARAGARHGAIGLLNTEWGDGGHPSPPGAAFPALALGAALAWNPTGPTGVEFDAAFVRLAYGLDDAAPLEAWRHAVALADTIRVWPALYAPLPTVTLPEVLGTEALERWEDAARSAAAAFAALAPEDPLAARDCAELDLALRVHALVAQRCLLARRMAAGATVGAGLRNLAATCDELVPEFEAAWLATSRPAGLEEVTAVFRRLATEARQQAVGV